MHEETSPGKRTRAPVLDTVDRVSELCFGLFMALTFVGTVSAATGGEAAGHKMLYTALGCNLAWGLADAVMYLVRTIADRARRHALALAIQRERDAAAGVRMLRERVSATLDPFISDDDLESIRKRIAASDSLPERARFVRDDFLAALGIFIIIVLSTFPVAAPLFSSSTFRPRSSYRACSRSRCCFAAASRWAVMRVGAAGRPVSR